MSELSPGQFEFLATLLKKTSGLVLSPEKGYLLESRLTPLARQRGLSRVAELVGVLQSGRDPGLVAAVTDAMTTNESFFFRDQTPFDIMRTHVLPMLHAARGAQRRLRIWCAAASTGQEPYSLAMMLAEDPASWGGWTIEIVGTDISPTALGRARKGLYSQFEVQRGLPIQLMMKYFDKAGESWQLADSIRNMVTYRPFNLLEPMASLGQFDVIFCRNVLIYFDPETKSKVLAGLHGQLASDGALFLGAAETVLGLTKDYRPVKELRGLYVPVNSPAFQARAA